MANEHDNSANQGTKYAANQVDFSDPATTWSKIARHIPDGANILDVGCSSGYLGEALIAAKHATLTGIELDPSDAEQARQRGFSEVFVGDLDTFDWSKLNRRLFDVIIFADVLEHLKDPFATLIDAAKYLSPSGVVAISVPNIAHISIRLELLEGNFIYESRGILDNTHSKYFTRVTLLKMIHDAGLGVEHLDVTTNDMPDGFVQSRLEQLGLTADKSFLKEINSVEARAFQYVVIASKNARAKSPEVELPQKAGVAYQQLVDMFNERSQELEHKKTEIAALQQELAAIRNSAAWKATHTLKRAKAKLWRNK